MSKNTLCFIRRAGKRITQLTEIWMHYTNLDVLNGLTQKRLVTLHHPSSRNDELLSEVKAASELISTEKSSDIVPAESLA